LRLRLTTELADADALVSARNCKENQSISDCVAPTPSTTTAPMTSASVMAGK